LANPPTIDKPASVGNAERALWLWTIYTCVLGTYQTLKQIPELMDMVTMANLQDSFPINEALMRQWTFYGYAALFVISVWVLWRLNVGRRWARGSVLGGFVIELLIEIVPPYHDLVGYIPDIPDIGLQIYALWLLYNRPGSDWFNQPKSHRW
jgi:hypothetical protein